MIGISTACSTARSRCRLCGALEPDEIEAIWAYIRSINDR